MEITCEMWWEVLYLISQGKGDSLVGKVPVSQVQGMIPRMQVKKPGVAALL